MTKRSLFSDYLTALHVPHTVLYSSSRFEAYPHKLALSGIEDLLDEYKVDTKRYRTGECADIMSLNPPFIAGTKTKGYVIVTEKDNVAGTIVYTDSGHHQFSVKAGDFLQIWNGEALVATPLSGACEPDLKLHRMKSGAESFCKWGLVVISFGLIAYWFVSKGVWRNWADVLSLVLYACGIYITYLLILKDSHVESDAANSVCGLIQANGCSTVLATEAASLFGVFPWCEIGFAYFTVSFLAMLVGGPECAKWLPWIAFCCLPFSVWSVLYQRFKAHAWCTLCLTVQLLFWLIAGVFFVGGDFHNPFPADWATTALLLAYVGAFMAIHRLVPLLFRYERMSPLAM